MFQCKLKIVSSDGKAKMIELFEYEVSSSDEHATFDYSKEENMELKCNLEIKFLVSLRSSIIFPASFQVWR